jgi:two-component system, chemotaxis family, sensor kinase CheA
MCANAASRRGTVELNAYHDSGSIVIEIVDDGNGLPKEKILAKAVEKGLVHPPGKRSPIRKSST